MTNEHLEHLIQEVLDGSANQAQREELVAILERDEKALAVYCRFCALDSSLHRLAVGNSQLQTMPAEKKVRHLSLRRRLLAIAAILMVGSGVVWSLRERKEKPFVSFEKGAGTVFSVNPGSNPDGNMLVVGSQVKMDQGTMVLRFDNGVISRIQGPAEWVIHGTDFLELQKGDAQFEVPEEGSGFRVMSPQLELTHPADLFDLRIAADKPDELEVIRGRAWVRQRRAEVVELPTGAVVRASPQQVVEPLPAADTGFEATIPGTLARLHWSFGSPRSGGWPAEGDLKETDRASAFPLAGNAPLLVDGVIGEAVSLFPGQTLVTQWDGILDAKPRTVAGWIRIPVDTPDAHLPATIVMWGNEKSNLAQMKWRVGLNPERYHEGGVKGALRTEWGDGRVIGVTDLRDGKWHHIASVYEGGNAPDNAHLVRLYVDGREEAVSSSAHQYIQTRAEAPLQFGGRDGRMDLDDFHIFEGALTPHQIQILARRVLE